MTVLSFILAVFIVVRHNSSFYNYSGRDAEILLKIYENFKYSVTEVAVPLFFIISGFNYFRNYDPSMALKKTKKRIKSLLIPYWFWNGIFTIFCIITSYSFISKYFIGRERFIASPVSVFCGFIYHLNCNSQFWFVFNLMLFAVINPLIYVVLKHKAWGGITLLLLYLTIFGFGLNLPIAFIYRTDSVFFYYLGAFLALNFRELVGIIKGNTKVSCIISIILIIQMLFLLLPNVNSCIRAIVILLGCFGFWAISSFFENVNCLKYINGGLNFLLYAMHGIVQPVVVKCIYLICPKMGWFSIINFVLSIFLTVLICSLIQRFTKNSIEWLYNVMSGWR